MDIEQTDSRPVFNNSNILTASNGASAFLFAPFTGFEADDDGFYSCLLIADEAIIFNRTLRLAVNVPTGTSSSTAIRFSSVSQEEIDQYFAEVFQAPPGLPTLEAIVRSLFIEKLIIVKSGKICVFSVCTDRCEYS